jgi:hypothetical protein
VSLALFLIVIGWLVIVGMNLGKVPLCNRDGTVRMDQYVRAKDILALVLPFLTTVAGFWLGSQGTAQAQNQAAEAHVTAAEAHVAAVDAQDQARRKADQMTAVVAYANSKLPAGEDVLEAAKAQHR